MDATKNNRPREAVKALSRLDPEGVWTKDWPPYWAVLAHAYHMLGRYRAQLKQARWGCRKFPESTALFASELSALAALGRIEEIDRLIDQSLNIKLNMTYAPGRLMNVTARELRVHGFKKESLRLLDRAIQWLNDRPDEEKAKKDYRVVLAYVYYAGEKWPESRILFEGLLKEDPENLWYLRNCGALAARRGDSEEALRISKQLEETKKPYLWGLPTYHRAAIASLLGEKETAVRLLQEAISQGMSYVYAGPPPRWNLDEDMDLDPLRDYPPFKELIKPKG